MYLKCVKCGSELNVKYCKDIHPENPRNCCPVCEHIVFTYPTTIKNSERKLLETHIKRKDGKFVRIYTEPLVLDAFKLENELILEEIDFFKEVW